VGGGAGLELAVDATHRELQHTHRERFFFF
jgi:hypothetical protein